MAISAHGRPSTITITGDPDTAIQLADTDGNPDTVADPAWQPLGPTPPFPDYDSGHGVEGGAVAQVLQRVFETDQVSFSRAA